MSNNGLFGSKSIRKGFLSSIRNIRQSTKSTESTESKETRYSISNQKQINNQNDSRNLNEIILKDVHTFDIDIKEQETSLRAKKHISKKIDDKLGYGIIKGHGLTNTKKICLVPDNINLYVIPKGRPFSHGKNTDNNTNEEFKYPKSRLSFSVSGCGHLIYGGTPILDMDIKFDPTYPDDENPSLVSGYSFVGIVTGELKFKSTGLTPLIEDLYPSVEKKSALIDLEAEATESHNPDIIPVNKLYNKIFHLSDLLRIISEFKESKPYPIIPSTFILISCRDIVENNIPPCPLLTRHNSNSMDYRHLFFNFVTNVKKRLINYLREISDIRRAMSVDEELRKEFVLRIKIYALIKKNLKKIKSNYRIDKLKFELLSMFLFETDKLDKISNFIARHEINQS